MVHLYVPPSLRRFAPRRVLPGPALCYVPLEYDLVAALRPRLVVDLGAGNALSFFTYCQSMHEHDIDGICYAIDTWPADAQVEPQATFDAISDHGRKFYPGIYYLVKLAPWEARRHFEEETIDLLRIDGTRPDVIGGADVEAWYRRVRPGGVIAWYGAAGAPKLWSLLASRCPSVTLQEAGGLGLAHKPGGAPRGELLRLLFVENRVAELERFYAHVHAHHEQRRLVAELRGREHDSAESG
jgi:hypothetical protein